MFRYILCISALAALLWYCPMRLIAQSPEPSISVTGIDENGLKRETFRIVRTIQVKRVYLPLLTMVFFDKNSDEIPVRYNTDPNDAELFSEKAFTDRRYAKSPPISAYYQVLHVIGSRLKASPQKIQIWGSTDGSETTADLARKRAERVKKFLVDVYKIDEQLIQVEASPDGLVPPERRSRPTGKTEENALIEAENRRVDIIGEWEIVKPIVVALSDTSVNPPKLIFTLNHALPPDRFASSELTVNQYNPDKGDDDMLVYKTFSVASPEFEWDLVENRNEQPKTNEPLRSRLLAKDVLNREYSSDEQVLEVEQRDYTKRTNVREKDGLTEFDLILFDFAKDSITATHKKIIDIIRRDGLVNVGTKITVYGYTDNTGDAKRNIERSHHRALSALTYLNEIHLDVNYYDAASVFAIGNGATDLNNDEFRTPESRMYCRTVRIRLESN